MRRVLVTGSSGHIGSAVAARVASCAELVGLDLVPGPYTTHRGDIQDTSLVRDLLERVDTVIHIAALHVPHLELRSEAEFQQVNVDGTRTLLDLAITSGVGRFVLTSTTSVYGCGVRASDRAVWVTENLEPCPEDIYDDTKLAAEELCREAATAGLSVAILRMSRCFPEPAHLTAFYRLYRGVDRRDVAEAHCLAATAPIDGCETVIVSADTPFQAKDCDVLWSNPWQVIEARRPGTRRAFFRRGWPLPRRIDRVYTIERAKRLLGFQPRHGIEAVLEAAD